MTVIDRKNISVNDAAITKQIRTLILAARAPMVTIGAKLEKIKPRKSTVTMVDKSDYLDLSKPDNIALALPRFLECLAQ
jgi:hypothetical protein